jgi:orotidine-5'-phosphate decarboxylase
MYEDRIIIALDVASAEEARSLVGGLGEKAGFYKVGLELYAVAGMEIVRELQAHGKQVFLDLKLFDIGETVKRTVEVLARTGIRFLTVHSSKAVMQAAVAGRGDAPLAILAVTVLTSFDDQDVHDLGYSGGVAQLVEWRARKCVECGVDGVIASPLDALAVRRMVGPRMLIVTPGVRSPGASRGDQKRVATPAEAIRDTADYLVLGRQITRAADPAAELERVLEEMAQADTARPGSSR